MDTPNQQPNPNASAPEQIPPHPNKDTPELPAKDSPQIPIPKARLKLPLPVMIAGGVLGVTLVLAMVVVFLNRGNGANSLLPTPIPTPQGTPIPASPQENQVTTEINQIQEKMDQADPSELDIKPPPLNYELEI